MAYNYKKLKGLEGKDNQGGFRQAVFLAPVSAFLVIAEFLATAGQGDTVKITADHTFPNGEGFIEMYTTLDTAKSTLEVTGERDGYGSKQVLEFFHPGSSEEAAEFFDRAKNDEFIVLAQRPDGKYLQYGIKGMHAEIKGKHDSGTVTSGRNGWTGSVEALHKQAFYSGEITIKPVV